MQLPNLLTIAATYMTWIEVQLYLKNILILNRYRYIISQAYVKNAAGRGRGGQKMWF